MNQFEKELLTISLDPASDLEVISKLVKDTMGVNRTNVIYEDVALENMEQRTNMRSFGFSFGRGVFMQAYVGNESKQVLQRVVTLEVADFRFRLQ